jgi:hypothetical protein
MTPRTTLGNFLAFLSGSARSRMHNSAHVVTASPRGVQPACAVTHGRAGRHRQLLVVVHDLDVDGVAGLATLPARSLRA